MQLEYMRECLACMKSVSLELQTIQRKAAELRTSLIKVGYFDPKGWRLRDDLNALQTQTRDASYRAEVKLEKVKRMLEDRRISASQRDSLLLQRIELLEINRSFAFEIDQLYSVAQDANIFAAIRTIWDDMKCFSRMIVSHLLRLSFAAVKQLRGRAQRLLNA